MFGGKEKGEIAYKAKLTFKSSYLWLLLFFFLFVSIVNYKWFTCTYSTGFLFLIPAECLYFFFLSLLWYQRNHQTSSLKNQGNKMSVTSLRKTFYVYHQLNKWQDRPATSMNFVL